MKYLQLSLAIGALTLALTLPAFAGQMHTPVAPPQPPPESCEMDCSSVSPDSVTEITLSFMQSMLALF